MNEPEQIDVISYVTSCLKRLSAGDTNFSIPQTGSFTDKEQLLFASLEQARKQTDMSSSTEGRCQWLIEHAPVCVHEIDMDGYLRSMNSEGLRMMGCVSMADIVGLDYMSVPIESQQENVRTLFEQARLGTAAEFEFQTDTSNGRLSFLSRFAPARGPDGEVNKVVGMTIDITELRKLEAQLRRSQRLEAVGQLAGGIAHDFNNLLAVILGNSELVQDMLEATAPEQELIAEVLQTVDRGASLTRRLLTFSHKQVLAPSAVDIPDCLNELGVMMRRTLGAEIELVIQAPKDLWLVLADRAQLENALLNLVLNARDATDGGGTVSLRAANAVIGTETLPRLRCIQPGEYVEISVHDNGSGIDLEDIEQVFDPFFSTKAIGKGTGLGLSMVYGFVKQSHGHVAIDTEPGRGTTVRVFLPRVGPRPVVEAPAKAQSLDLAGTGRVLFVEDNLSVRAPIAVALRAEGYQVVEAGDGETAVNMLTTQHFDLLLTDLLLGSTMNGVDVAGAARSLQPGIALLFMTGYAEHDLMRSTLMT
ncbi:MAG: PAS domain S-box-containing protein, partial [Cognaticolwellia sp.]